MVLTTAARACAARGQRERQRVARVERQAGSRRAEHVARPCARPASCRPRRGRPAPSSRPRARTRRSRAPQSRPRSRARRRGLRRCAARSARCARRTPARPRRRRAQALRTAGRARARICAEALAGTSRRVARARRRPRGGAGRARRRRSRRSRRRACRGRCRGRRSRSAATRGGLAASDRLAIDGGHATRAPHRAARRLPVAAPGRTLRFRHPARRKGAREPRPMHDDRPIATDLRRARRRRAARRAWAASRRARASRSSCSRAARCSSTPARPSTARAARARDRPRRPRGRPRAHRERMARELPRAAQGARDRARAASCAPTPCAPASRRATRSVDARRDPRRRAAADRAGARRARDRRRRARAAPRSSRCRCTTRSRRRPTAQRAETHARPQRAVERADAAGVPRARFRELLERARAEGFRPTDDAALHERYVGPVPIVPGRAPHNLKITTPRGPRARRGDPARAQRARERRVSLRVGLGFDVHRLVPGRPCVLGGVELPHPRGPARPLRRRRGAARDRATRCSARRGSTTSARCSPTRDRALEGRRQRAHPRARSSRACARAGCARRSTSTS